MKKLKFSQWLIMSLIAIIIGVSIILNITYLPKYFALINNHNNFLTVEILGFDETQNENNPEFDYWYQTQADTLGNLMGTFSQTYGLKNDGALLRELETITFYVNGQKKHWIGGTKDKHHILIYNKNKKLTAGIDFTYLGNNDQYFLQYK